MKIRETRILVVWAGLLASLSIRAQAGEKISRVEYVNTYSELAMLEMLRVGIPASIKLAQACLESDNGNSRLALRANNHFGIKCHDWTGKTVYQDDDARRDCFRSYPSVYDSYRDHSDFLAGRPRYASLFDLPPDDYRQWAHRLKQAGYATLPGYAALLIKIIEENDLHRFDEMVMEGSFDYTVDSASLAPRHSYGTSREIR
ncbi:MAG: mannosyl-glycoprotein endo-beta-N-acetylglucosamidase, partial [Bacteroidetes bacterium]